MKDIIIFCQSTDSVGVRVVVDNFSKQLGREYNVIVSDTLPESKDNLYVIPYGIKQTYIALKEHYNVPVSLMVDYYSLGHINSLKFFFKRLGLWNINNYIIGLLRYVKYYCRERWIFSHFNNFMYVSQSDIDNMKKRYPKKKYYCVPNGVNIPNEKPAERKQNGICFGFLSMWVEGSFLEHKWFIDEIWKPIIDRYPNVTLKICGRDATKEMIRYFSSIKGIEFIGEVDSLSDFFNMIDIYIAPIPKGCGILNKVLDAFAYQKLVIGITPSFSGFSYMKESFVECNTVDDYLNFIEDYTSNKEKYTEYIKNAFDNVVKYNNWENNYTKFIKELQEDKLL